MLPLLRLAITCVMKLDAADSELPLRVAPNFDWPSLTWNTRRSVESQTVCAVDLVRVGLLPQLEDRVGGDAADRGGEADVDQRRGEVGVARDRDRVQPGEPLRDAGGQRRIVGDELCRRADRDAAESPATG